MAVRRKSPLQKKARKPKTKKAGLSVKGRGLTNKTPWKSKHVRKKKVNSLKKKWNLAEDTANMERYLDGVFRGSEDDASVSKNRVKKKKVDRLTKQWNLAEDTAELERYLDGVFRGSEDDASVSKNLSKN